MATKTSRASNAQKRMVKNQKRAAMAQKRNAQAQQIKAKASVNNFSNPKTNNMGKTNTIGVMVKVKTKAGVNNFIAFETDPVIGAIESGQIKALALASNQPLARLPKLPLASATKGFEDYQFSIWIGVAASAKTPDSQIAAVHKATYTALGNPEIRKIIETAGSTVAEPMTLAQLDAFYKKEAVTAAAIAKSIKLEPQ